MELSLRTPELHQERDTPKGPARTMAQPRCVSNPQVALPDRQVANRDLMMPRFTGRPRRPLHLRRFAHGGVGPEIVDVAYGCIQNTEKLQKSVWVVCKGYLDSKSLGKISDIVA